MAKQGDERVYESVLLRRTYRDGNKVRNQTVANLSTLPDATVAAIEATLKGQVLVAAGSQFTITRSLPHGHVAAVATTWPTSWGCRPCWGQQAGLVIWRWR